MMYKKYKDAKPESTVNKIINMLEAKLNIKMSLKITERANGIFSGILYDPKAMWNTSGKGTTEEYCAASAYGEAVEHLCNFFAYETAILSKEAIEALGFEKDPNESIMDVNELSNESSDVLLDLHESYSLLTGRVASDNDLIMLWKNFLNRESIPFVPYYSVKSKRFKLIPHDIVFYLCGSNGGGAGNSPEEAIGHACDEILERFVKFSIYMRDLTPPQVPKDYIQQRCPELIEIIEKLEQNEGFKIIVKDASMGVGFSVLSVLMINQKKSEYLVNFGAHPLFEIALERCLTEMLQAFIPSNPSRKKMEKWTLEKQARAKFPQNWVTILKDDSGVIPDSYFGGKDSWDFVPWPEYTIYSNELGMNIQLKQLLNIAPDVYIHDTSYLGFPSYKVYVPTVSTSHIPFDEFQLYCYRVMEKFQVKLQSRNFSIEDISEIEATIFSENTFINGLIFRGLGEDNFHCLHAAACFDIMKFEDAKKYLRLANVEFSECLIRTIELQQNGMKSTEIDHLITLFFEENLSEISKKWRDEGAFNSMISFYEKKGVSFSPRVIKDQNIRYASNNLHIKLKEVMLENDRQTDFEKLLRGVER